MKKLLSSLDLLWSMIRWWDWCFHFDDEYRTPFFDWDADESFENGFVIGREYSYKIWRLWLVISHDMY